jgi:rare lipoprotein A (peptidoglycan hydrolase)
MKKIFLLSIIILPLFACSGQHYKKYKTAKHQRQFDGKFNRKQPVKKIRPSEMMQVGTARDSYQKGGSSDDFQGAQVSTEYLEKNNFNDDFDFLFDENQKYVGIYKVGEPYEIEGKTYYPQEYDSYKEVGVASWYGSDFNGKNTSNGEIYNLNSITAAHQTIPLPSVAKITNLENDKSLIVRINDRGPFAKNRIIDLSEKSAEILGFKNKGTVQVKVELLKDETDDLLEALGISR